MQELTPKTIVEQLNKYIIGQDDAKKSVAIALRNRYRRSQLPEEMKEEITPKNILMVGPTGVGKTEIARRLAKLVNAPFVKVEATKFTEVGYVGRDVDSIIRDLVEASIRMVKQERVQSVNEVAKDAAIEIIVNALVPTSKKKEKPAQNPFEMILSLTSGKEEDKKNELPPEEEEKVKTNQYYIKEQIKNGRMNDELVEIEVEDNSMPAIEMLAGGSMDQLGSDLQGMFNGILPKKTKHRKVKIKDAIRILTQQEAQKMIDQDSVHEEAIERAEQSGIVFIDEIDKVAGKSASHGPDVSREGVQRDILPIVEGSTVMTKYGPVKTDYMLFIAAGAFHVSKVTDLIPELQGRFPIRVTLKPLTKENFKEILTVPNNALTKQYAALLETENIEITFEEAAIDLISEYAVTLNDQYENIGARRLYTIMEDLFQDLFFEVDNSGVKRSVVIDQAYVEIHITDNALKKDLNKYII